MSDLQEVRALQDRIAELEAQLAAEHEAAGQAGAGERHGAAGAPARPRPERDLRDPGRARGRAGAAVGLGGVGEPRDLEHRPVRRHGGSARRLGGRAVRRRRRGQHGRAGQHQRRPGDLRGAQGARRPAERAAGRRPRDPRPADRPGQRRRQLRARPGRRRAGQPPVQAGVGAGEPGRPPAGPPPPGGRAGLAGHRAGRHGHAEPGTGRRRGQAAPGRPGLQPGEERAHDRPVLRADAVLVDHQGAVGLQGARHARHLAAGDRPGLPGRWRGPGPGPATRAVERLVGGGGGDAGAGDPARAGPVVVRRADARRRAHADRGRRRVRHAGAVPADRAAGGGGAVPADRDGGVPLRAVERRGEHPAWLHPRHRCDAGQRRGGGLADRPGRHLDLDTPPRAALDARGARRPRAGVLEPAERLGRGARRRAGAGRPGGRGVPRTPGRRPARPGADRRRRAARWPPRWSARRRARWAVVAAGWRAPPDPAECRCARHPGQEPPPGRRRPRRSSHRSPT